MLFVGAVDIALGWAWHTAYRARLHWKLRREGALAAAAVVALIGVVDNVRSYRHPIVQPVTTTEAAPAFTASATPTTTVVERPVEILPAAEPAAPASIAEPAAPALISTPVETVAAVPSPVPSMADDPIGAKIMERLGDEVATGSLDDAETPTVVKPKATKPAAKRKPNQAGG